MLKLKGKHFGTLAAALMVLIACTSAALAHDKYGVLDAQNHYVIQPEYEQIAALTPDLFACYSKMNENKDGFLIPSPDSLRLLDRNGHAVDLPIPQKCSLERAFQPADIEKPKYCDFSQENFYYQISGPNGLALLNGTGKTIVTQHFGVGSDAHFRWFDQLPKQPSEILKHLFPNYNKAIRLNESNILLQKETYMAPVNDASALPALVVDSKGTVVNEMPIGAYFRWFTEDSFVSEIPLSSTKEGSTKGTLLIADFNGSVRNKIDYNPWTPYSPVPGVRVIEQPDKQYSSAECLKRYSAKAEDGTLLIPPSAGRLSAVSPDRFIKVTPQQHFDSAECAREYGSFPYQFRLLLQDFDLIGMPRERLQSLIGNQRKTIVVNDLATYRLDRRGLRGRLSPHQTYVSFRFAKNNKLIAWRKSGGKPIEQVEDWITDNMVSIDGTLDHLRFKDEATSSNQ